MTSQQNWDLVFSFFYGASHGKIHGDCTQCGYVSIATDQKTQFCHFQSFTPHGSSLRFHYSTVAASNRIH